MKRNLKTKSILDPQSLLDAFDAHSIPMQHARTLWRHLIQLDQPDYHQIPEFPRKACRLLDAEFTSCSSRVIQRTDAGDQSTTKLLIELQDGQCIETVIMRYGEVELRSFPDQERQKLRDRQARLTLESESAAGDWESGGNENRSEDARSSRSLISARPFKSNKRATVCLSSQVGCAMGCTFCATGTMGRLANLTAGEILEQLYHASRIERIRNVVMMGMGEPLDNYKNVLLAIQGMTDTVRFGLSSARISVSTVGIVPRIYQMMEDMPHVCLALSLHAGSQKTRLKIVPSAKSYDIQRILQAADSFVDNQNHVTMLGAKDLRRKPLDVLPSSNRQLNRRRKLMLEYVLLGPDVNCLPNHAHELGKLLAETPQRLQNSILNLIPYNPTAAGEPYGYCSPSQSIIQSFMDIVKSYGVVVLVRQELGQDVNAACGQLVVTRNAQQTSSLPSEDRPVRDMEDLVPSRRSISTGTRSRQKRRATRALPTKILRDRGAAPRPTSRIRMELLVGLVVLCVLMRLFWQLWVLWKTAQS